MNRPFPTPLGHPARSRTWILAGLLVAITFLAYLPVWHNGFIWDDFDYIVGNQHLHDWQGLQEMWLKPKVTPQYYPLVFTTFWLEYHLWGLNPAGYHLVNVLLQGLAALLLWRILTRLQMPGAWLAAALFALHPVQVESVAWITERKNVLSAVFYLLAAMAYLRFAELADAVPPVSRRWYYFGAAFLCYVAALWSKTVTCSLPAILLVVFWWKTGRWRRRDFLFLTPFFLTGLVLGLTTAWLEKNHVGAGGGEWSLTFVERSLVAGRALCFYLASLVFPADLTFIYPRWQIDPGVWWQWLFPAAVAGGLAALWCARARLGRGPLAAALFFVITLAPAIGFINVYPMRFSFVADHFQYLACLGPLALAAAGLKLALDRVPERLPWLPPALAAALLIVLGTLTWRQCGMYLDDQTVWQTTILRNPNAWIARVNLGNHLAENGQVDDAIAQFEQAIQINPRQSDAHTSLGTALMQKNRVEDALAQYQTAVEINPDDHVAQDNLGILLLKAGRTGAAIPHFQRALQFEPDDVKAERYLAWVLATCPDASLRDGARAVELARQANAFTDGNNPVMLHILAAALAEDGRFPEAVATARRAMQLAAAQPRLAGQIENELALYQAGSSFHTPE